VVCWDCDGAVVEQDSLELHYAVSPEHPSCTFCGVGKRIQTTWKRFVPVAGLWNEHVFSYIYTQHIKNHHATELYDSTPNEIEVSQSNGQAAVDDSSNVSVTS
jgi:hypothetical protein